MDLLFGILDALFLFAASRSIVFWLCVLLIVVCLVGVAANMLEPSRASF
jgi:uncharacterized membrane protein